MNNDPVTQQRYLGSKGLVVFLAALTAFPALSTDLYLPALPTMTVHFAAPEYQTNLTLTLFFIFYALSLVISGPLSDRFGRKPVALAGLVCYTAGGLLCAFSGNVFQLMGFRVFQALGAGAASTVATAVIKDTYQGRKRELTLAVVQSITILAPLFAPMIGALILRFTSWRGAFVAQAICGLVVLVVALWFQETVRSRLTGNPLAALKRLGVVLNHRTFTPLLFIFSLFTMMGLMFIASSSYIYEVTFGVSSQVYSFYYAMFGVGIALGPASYILLSRRIERNTIMTACFLVCAVSGILVLLVGVRGPWSFILSFAPATVAFGCVRPPSTYLMLQQHEADAGSVSGLITASNMVMGSIGTVIVSIDLWGRVELMGVFMLGVSLLGFLLWMGIGRPRVRAQASAQSQAAAEAEFSP